MTPAHNAPIRPAPVYEFRDPFAEPPERYPDPAVPQLSPWSLRLRAVAVIALFTLAMAARAYRVEQVVKHASVPNGIKADGRLVVNGGQAQLRYTPGTGAFEERFVQHGDATFYPDLKFREITIVRRLTDSGRETIGLSTGTGEDLNDPRTFRIWLNNRNVGEGETAQRYLTPQKTKLAGHQAWRWEYTSPEGQWNYAVRVPLGKTSYDAW